MKNWKKPKTCKFQLRFSPPGTPKKQKFYFLEKSSIVESFSDKVANYEIQVPSHRFWGYLGGNGGTWGNFFLFFLYLFLIPHSLDFPKHIFNLLYTKNWGSDNFLKYVRFMLIWQKNQNSTAPQGHKKFFSDNFFIALNYYPLGLSTPRVWSKSVMVPCKLRSICHGIDI